jgi:exopolyphosphatase/guanosine-5'-triphosphate,3'-diphosphate pyrophosphatase
MIHAIIDIGTNNTRLAVFDVPENAGASKSKIILERDNITRLGENLRFAKRLGEEPMRRTLDVLAIYKEEAKAAGAKKIVAAATAAMRAASNSTDFIKTARKIGLDLEIISGELEAELSFRGVLTGMSEPPEHLMVIDIGGGSTEFAFGGRDGLKWSESFPFGAVGATEKFFRHDPPIDGEIAEFYDLLCSEIRLRIGTYGATTRGCIFAGVAGTVSTLAMIDLGLETFEPSKVHGHILRRDSVRRITNDLLDMTTQARRAIPGMEPLRADIIHAGAAILDAAFEVLSIEEMLASLCDLRHGILDRELRRNAGA